MEKLKEVGRPIKRVDAADKVTGRAKFTDDLCPKPCLEAKILHSTIGNGRVISIDASEALKVPGVVAVFTCFDVPDIVYPVGGHPWYADRDASHRDIADRKLLDDRVRIYGDNIGVVVAEDTVACDRALKLIRWSTRSGPWSTTPRSPWPLVPQRAARSTPCRTASPTTWWPTPSR